MTKSPFYRSEHEHRNPLLYFSYCGEQGWRSGESARPGFDSRTRRHMWVEFAVGCLLCSERFFSGYSGFPPLLKKTNISKFQFQLGKVSRNTLTLKIKLNKGIRYGVFPQVCAPVLVRGVYVWGTLILVKLYYSAVQRRGTFIKRKTKNCFGKKVAKKVAKSR